MSQPLEASAGGSLAIGKGASLTLVDPPLPFTPSQFARPTELDWDVASVVDVGDALVTDRPVADFYILNASDDDKARGQGPACG